MGSLNDGFGRLFDAGVILAELWISGHSFLNILIRAYQTSDKRFFMWSTTVMTDSDLVQKILDHIAAQPPPVNIATARQP